MTAKKKKAVSRQYSQGRVKRGPAPPLPIKQKGYRKALPELRRDFEDRCAYCMRHIATETEMQVDHFDPRQKNDRLQVYSNLFLSDAHCNGAKSDTWPSEEEQKAGIRFLNCCTEQDYGEVIFENPKTHELEGTTPAAIYHIEMIDLNDPGLVAERKRRYDFNNNLRNIEEGANADILKIANDIRSEAEFNIPEIPAPPGYWDII